MEPTEIPTCQRPRPKINLGFKPFVDIIQKIKVTSENNRRVVNFHESLNKPNGQTALQPIVKTPERKTETYPKVDSKNSRILNKSYEKSNYDHGKCLKNSRIPVNKTYAKGNYDCRKYQFDKESNIRSKNHNYNVKGNVEEKHFDTHSKSSARVNSQDEETEDCIEFKRIRNSREILNPNEKNLKIVLKNDVTQSIPCSKNDVTQIITCSKNDATQSIPCSKNDTTPSNTTNNLPAFNIICNSQTEQSCSKFDNALLFQSNEENYIPPPSVCQLVIDSMDAYNSNDSSSSASAKSETCPLQNGNLDSSEDSGDEINFSLTDLEHIEAITEFILAIVKEKSACNASADRVIRDLNTLFKNEFEGHSVELYGSYYNDLAISTSDINLVITSDFSIKRSFMFEVYKVLSKGLHGYYVYPYEDGITAHQIKIQLAHPDTGVNCQIAYLGKYKTDICKMGQFLRQISTISHDKKLKTLIIATKIWAEYLYINEVEDGKLHSIGYVLMVLHFLQHIENPILPNFPCGNAEVELLSPNNLSIGELWLAFLKYYAITFNWKRDVITINSEEIVSKKSKGWENYWIAVEDPFTRKNVAETVVNSDIADYIKACFRSSYEYFCKPPDNTVLYSESQEDESEHSSSYKWQFSFQQCFADQSDIFCENCDELKDVCEDCQKKMYVQPMLTVPKMTDSFLQLVKESLTTIYEKYMLSYDEICERQKFVETLQIKVRRIHPDAELKLFGSSANGFGFKNSDLDICLTFKSNKVINTASVLKDVRFLLRKDKNFDRVVVIFNANIPIVKFHYHPKGWRGDISLDNSLAIRNSNLLRTYSVVDERCKILGCALKLLAKKALIVEVTEKALSSYSYLNMVIYFLQQTDPPVLPVLQDYKFRKNFSMVDIVEGYNAWFCEDLDYIKSEFKTENKTPVEQLWLELLDFYCSFDSNKFISIRQKDPVCIDKGKYSARLFNIQDPFIETKNLGCVVSAKKAQETKSVLSRARQLFRTPVKELPKCVKDIEDFFFSTRSLTGRIHKEAHCDMCGKYGHEKQECKHSSFPPKRNNFRQFAKRNLYKSRNPKQRPKSRGYNSSCI